MSKRQIDTYQSCNRKWWFNKILGIEIPQHPSAAIGSEVHAQLEAYLEEKSPADSLGPIARTALPFAPKPGSVYVEESIETLGLTAAGLPALGYIDVLDLKSDPPQVLDWKTTSNFRYAKSEDELLCNVQMSVYAKATLAMFERLDLPTPSSVRVTHVAMLTKAPHEARRTSAVMTLPTIHENWKHVERTVAEMKATALLDTPDKVAPTESACHAYGGCPFRDRCNALKATRSIFAGLGSAETKTTQETDTMSSTAPTSAKAALLARLGVKTKTTAPVVEEAPVAPAAPAPVAQVAPTAPAPKATTGNTADALMARLRGNLAEPPKSVTPVASTPASITPPDAPSNEAIAQRLVAADEAEAAPAADTDTTASKRASGAARRPRNAAARLTALGYTDAEVAAFSNEEMHHILDNNLAPVKMIEEVIERSDEAKKQLIEAMETSVKDTLDAFHAAVFNGVPSSKTALDTGYESVSPQTGLVTERREEPTETEASFHEGFSAGHAAGYEQGYKNAAEELREEITRDVMASAPKAAPVDGLRLYVDCRPLKADGIMELDAFLAPIMAKVAANAKVPHYSMIPYAQGPAQVAALVSTQPPTGIIVADTRLPATNAVLEVLLPYAVEVVRGLR